MFVRFEAAQFGIGETRPLCVDPWAIRSVQQCEGIEWSNQPAEDYIEVRYQIGPDSHTCVIKGMAFDEVLNAIYRAKLERGPDAMRSGSERPAMLPEQDRRQTAGEPRVTINYDPDGTPELSTEMLQAAQDAGMGVVHVICDEPDAQLGDATGVSFWTMAAFLPRQGDRLHLQNGTVCEVKRTHFKVANREGLMLLVPNVGAVRMPDRQSSDPD